MMNNIINSQNISLNFAEFDRQVLIDNPGPGQIPLPAKPQITAKPQIPGPGTRIAT